MSAGIFMSSYSLGTFIGPTVGGFIFTALEEAAVDREKVNKKFGF